MDFMGLIKWNNIKKAWNWIWNSDSFASWIIALILIFVLVKFIFFPILALIMGTSLPLAGVESSSMDHQIIRNDFSIFELCGNRYAKEEKQYIDFDEYWDNCGSWYEDNEISKKEFSNFPLKNGFRKGDIIVAYGRFEPEIGDIIIFKPSLKSTAPRPIIHRIVKIEDNKEKIIETKGDHNADQLTISNNIYKTDETNIYENQVIGKAILRVPYLGWPKIWLVDFLKLFYH